MKKKAIIVDLDGTFVQDPLAGKTEWTNPDQVDWDAWNESRRYLPRNQWCYELIRNSALNGCEVIYLTGREGSPKGSEVARHWLLMHSPVQNYILKMRPINDHRPDYIVKKEMFITEIARDYDVILALDDKKEIHDMWMSMGIQGLFCGVINPEVTFVAGAEGKVEEKEEVVEDCNPSVL